MLELVFRHHEECWLGALDRKGSPCGRGFKVEDGYDGTSRTMYLSIGIIGPEDSRGLPIQLNMKQAPAIIGGCPLCKVVGCRCSIDVTIYACAVSYTKPDSDLRARLHREFGSLPQLPADLLQRVQEDEIAKKKAKKAKKKAKKRKKEQLSNMETHLVSAYKVCVYMQTQSENRRPALWSNIEARESSSRMDAKADEEDEPFRAGEDAYSALFGPDFDKMGAALIDLAHEIAGLLSHLLAIVAGVKKGPGAMNKKRLAFEKLLKRDKRFAKIGKGKSKRFPFQFSKSVGNTLERFMLDCCRLPRGSAAMRRPFSNPGSMKLVRLCLFIVCRPFFCMLAIIEFPSDSPLSYT